MLDRLVNALVNSPNEAADDLLLEALRLGTDGERGAALGALMRRKAVRGLSGVIGQYDRLPEPLQETILSSIKEFHHALRECGRSDDVELRMAAMRLIALGRQGKLAYVLSENLHDLDETLSKSATEAMVALARWVSVETRKLQRSGVGYRVSGFGEESNATPALSSPETRDPRPETRPELASSYDQLVQNRPDIEAAVARAMDVHRGKHLQDLLRAALLLCDWPGSKTLAILQTMKHGGQSPMVRRLQQPPAAEHVEAFLLGASHGQLRSHFGIVFSHIEEAPVLDSLLRKTHWLKDHQLQLCVHQVSRGAWWGEKELARDLERRPPSDAARVGEWLAVSGIHDVVQDERMEQLRVHAKTDVAARVRLLRFAMARKRGASVQLIKSFLLDADERLVRIAAREIIRRRPADFENTLLQMLTNAPDSVRRVVTRSIGQVGFDHFWNRFDRMEKSTRKQAGRAMLKLLPDAIQRLGKRLSSGPVDQRVKAMQIVQELELAESLKQQLQPLCNHPDSRVRSKAVMVYGSVASVPTAEVLLDKVLHDNDPRVRANAIEVLEGRMQEAYVPILATRARSSHNRERANAIKALCRMKVTTATSQLMNMLKDERGEHRISALWALRQIGWWQLLNEVGNIAKGDQNLRVRRYALGILKGIAETVQAQKKADAANGDQRRAG